MEKLFTQTFDAVEIGEESKQKIKDKLIEYQNNLVISKNQKSERKFKWTMPRIAIAASTAVVLLFCAIFFPIMAFNGGGGGQDMTAIYKSNLLSAINDLAIVESYVETIDVTIGNDDTAINAKTTTKYLKRNGTYISEGILEQDGNKTCDFYSADGYFYILPANNSSGGIKFRLEEKISINTFFSKSFGVLSTELVEQLSDESMFKAEKNKDNVDYSFRISKPHELIEDCEITVNYVVVLDRNGKILKIEQNSSTELGGLIVKNAYSVSKYDYKQVEVNLPDNLDSYLEQAGVFIGI